MTSTLILRTVAVVTAAACATVASAQATATPHLMVQPSELKWSGGNGLRFANVEGDPQVAGAPYALLIELDKGSWIPPHWHPKDKRIVVLQGSLLMGMGEQLDSLHATAMPAGSFVVVPANSRHYEGGGSAQTRVLLVGIGPLTTTFVNAPPKRPASR